VIVAFMNIFFFVLCQLAMEGEPTVAHTKFTFGRTFKCTHYGTKILAGA